MAGLSVPQLLTDSTHSGASRTSRSFGFFRNNIVDCLSGGRVVGLNFRLSSHVSAICRSLGSEGVLCCFGLYGLPVGLYGVRDSAAVQREGQQA